MNSPGLNDKILCYLTPEANAALKEMVAAGFDQDLALSILEQLWPEESIFELEVNEG
jgi:hypothetical protein